MKRVAFIGLCGLWLFATGFAQTPPPHTAPVPKPITPVAPVPFPPDSKIGFINLQAVFAQCEYGKAGQKQMQALQDKTNADLAAKNKTIQSLNDDIQKQ